MIILFLVIAYRAPITPWGDVTQAVIYHQVFELPCRRCVLIILTDVKTVTGWSFLLNPPILKPENACVVSGRTEVTLNHVFLHLGSEVFVKIGPKTDSRQVLETAGILLNSCFKYYCFLRK
jgi:hypothetical protein